MIVKASSYKAIKEGKSKWKFTRNDDLTGDFCILGRVNTLYVPWISPVDIGGNRRIECNFFNLLSLVGDTTDFNIFDFQKKNKGLFCGKV